MHHRYLKNVATLSVDRDQCVGCELCTKVCPHGVLMMADGKASIVEIDQCMECGACSRNCPTAAIAVSPGVGCAAAIINGFITGKEPSCGCDDGNSGCC